jgi:hypothetical protein
VRIHRPVTTRSDFDNVIDDNDPGPTLYTLDPMPVASLGRIGENLAVNIGLAGSNQDVPTVAIRQPGEYPVEVSLTNTGTPTSSFTTWLVVVDASDAPIAKPLMVSFIWQLVANPATMPDGSVDPAVSSQMRPNGRLDRIADVLDDAEGLPFSLVAGPETLGTWSKLAHDDTAYERGFTRVRSAARASTTQLLPSSYVPVDIPTLEASGLGDQVVTQLLRGADTLKSVVGTQPDRQTAFVDPADDATLDELREAGITRVAVRDGALTPVEQKYTPAQGFPIATAAGRSQGVATAPFIERLLNGPDSGVLKAQRVLAALAEVAYEFPTTARGLVLASPVDWTPDPAAMTALIKGLSDFPLVQPASLDDLFAGISTAKTQDGVDVVRSLRTVTPGVLPLTLEEYATASEELAAYRAVAGAKDPVVVDGEEALQTALSNETSPERARASIQRIAGLVQTFTDSVKVDAKRITLTAKRASIPLSFENNLKPARPLTVRVHLASEKLVFPDGTNDQLITLQPGKVTIGDKFRVEARASGTFPMEISITSADGKLQFGPPVRVTVRSAVFSGFALAVTIAALVFLAGWWANHVRRTRRDRRAAALNS